MDICDVDLDTGRVVRIAFDLGAEHRGLIVEIRALVRAIGLCCLPATESERLLQVLDRAEIVQQWVSRCGAAREGSECPPTST